MTTNADVVVLINKQGDRLAIWHVVIDPSWPMGRLCGAWVDTVAPALYVQRYLLPFGDRLPEELTDVTASSAGQFNANETRAAIETAIEKLDARHKDSPTKAGKPRAPITWPRLPAPLDWADLPVPPRGVADDPLTSETIAVANWVSQLAAAWSSIEVTRLSRDYLADGDTTPRPMPVALRT
ncbi:hypothetical protein [Mycolicibacterium conceptionense]|uniref:hypothetical protein n=1 Tax=Mycolicibacterium conceptionense TaxID=451644 RepID=UPI00096D8FA1|nr:hypothetical protein [Mycolicibacterium conceptionense]OMB88078.1 hypothetical protein A5743_01105 [Mycolicibacterium conceptionense]